MTQQFADTVRHSIAKNAPQMEANIIALARLIAIMDGMPLSPPPTRWQRFKRRIPTIGSVRDAWRVLTNDAYIDDEYPYG